MKQYKISITDSAERDLLDSYYYICFELENPIAAEKFKIAIQNKIKTLIKTPLMGGIYEPLSEYRVVHALKYRIFYTVDQDAETVVIVRVFYARRDNPKEKDLL